MKTKLQMVGLILALACSLPFSARANRDGFNDVVKAIEKFYQVKHQNIPFLARAGMKAMRTVAKIKGGELKRIAEAGSFRVAMFEDQNFDSRGEIASFKKSVQDILDGQWSALVQELSARDEQQTHIFIREAGPKFQVLIIEIERHEATVVEATLRPDALKQLLKDPEGVGKSITDEATTVDP